MASRIMVFMVLSFLSGCSSKDFIQSNARPKSIGEFYATDRNYLGYPAHEGFYGNDRDSLTYGTLKLERLPSHSIGKLDDTTLTGNENHDFELKDKTLCMKKEDFFGQLFRNKAVEKKRDILLYIHGFNTTFDEAALTMAQVAYDLDFKGDALFYSWPSTGKLLGYVRDQNNTDWSLRNLSAFLRELASKADDKSICLLAHSMGNRELLGAFVDLMRNNPDLKKKFRVIILAAPDVDAEIFCRDIASYLTDQQTLVTIYVSRRDTALNASKELSGYVRAGGVNKEPLVVNGIDTVDVTNIDTVPLGHSYFAQSRLVLSDMYSIINNGQSARFRFSLTPVEFTTDGKVKNYWIFEK
jgi:esterase/lipase superfamily enzyme